MTAKPFGTGLRPSSTDSHRFRSVGFCHSAKVCRQRQSRHFIENIIVLRLRALATAAVRQSARLFAWTIGSQAKTSLIKLAGLGLRTVRATKGFPVRWPQANHN